MLSIKRKKVLTLQLLNYENISLREGRHSIGTSWFYVSLEPLEKGTSTERRPRQMGLWQAYGGGAFSPVITEVGGLIMGNVTPGVVVLGA